MLFKIQLFLAAINAFVMLYPDQVSGLSVPPNNFKQDGKYMHLVKRNNINVGGLINGIKAVVQVNNRNNQNKNNNRPGANNGAGFCASVGLGGVLADGTQKNTSTCSQTVQGALPEFKKCVSSLIIKPANGARIRNGANFTFSVKTDNIDDGFFDNPNTDYFKSPQTLNAQGIIEGHQHVTMQKLNSRTNPPPVDVVTFFRGLDGNTANGILTTIIPGSATARNRGTYRICTMSGSRGHQPTLCGRARRGPQDDCIRINVV